MSKAYAVLASGTRKNSVGVDKAWEEEKTPTASEKLHIEGQKCGMQTRC